MEFWDEFFQKINSAAEYTIKETEKLTETAKLKYRLSKAKNRLELLYMSIGKLRYEETVLCKEAPEELYDGFNSQVTATIADIESLKNEIAAIRDHVICPNCGTKIANDADYCSKCGAKQNE